VGKKERHYKALHRWPGGRAKGRGGQPAVVPGHRVLPVPDSDPEPDLRQLYEFRDLLRRVGELEELSAWLDRGGGEPVGQE
jgi:hypothetical protein